MFGTSPENRASDTMDAAANGRAGLDTSILKSRLGSKGTN